MGRPVALADAQIAAQARLRTLAGAAALRAWQGLRSWDEEDVPRWLVLVVPLLLAVQRAAVTTTDAYVARALGRAPLGIDPLPVIDRVRGDARIPEVYRRPFVTVWSDLQAGKPFPEAVAAGGARVESMVEMDVQLAHFGALQAVQDADPVIRGWRRVADPGACEFCLLVNGAFVKRADASPLHNRCGCGLEPATEDGEPTPLPEGVAVHEHGEYGLVLGDPAHDHLSEADALAR